MPSSYAVVELGDAGNDGLSGSNPAVTATDEWARDIVDISKPAPVLADDLFHPVISKVNQVCLGMRVFGTGVPSDVGGLGYRLWPTYTGVSFALVVTPVFYSLGVSWMMAGISSFFSFVPMMVLSNRDETKAMCSIILGHRIRRLLKENEHREVEELAKVRGAWILLPDWIFSIVFLSLVFVLPHVFIVTPMAKALPDDATLQTMSLIGTVALSLLSVCFFSVFYFFNSWAPLMELYTREINDQSEEVVTHIINILDDAMLSPREAQERLGILHDRVLEPLREDFRGTLEPYMRSLFIVFLLTQIPAVTMAVSTVDEQRSTIVIGATEASVIRFSIATFMILMAPLSMRMLLKTLAMPWRSWCRLEKRLRHAGIYVRAAEKFGGGDVLEKWLERNSMAIRLFGVPVDNDLAGKVAGLAASVMGGVVLYLSRVLHSPS